MSLKPPTVLVLAYHFYPSNEIGARRMTALARYLADKGIRVVVVSTFGDQAIERGAEVLPGITAVPVVRPRRAILDTLIRLKRSITAPTNPGNQPKAAVGGHNNPPNASLAGKARELYFRGLYFVDGSKRWGWRASNAAVVASREYDVRLLIASGPPPSTLLAGARAARKANVPFVADFRDPWSDYLAFTYPDRRMELYLVRLLERYVLENSAAVTSTGGDVAALLKGRYPRISNRVHVVRNGYDGAVAAASVKTESRLSVLFAGELYAGRNPFPLLAAVEWLLARPEVDATRINVTFMGKADAYDGQSLVDWMRGKRCASMMAILPPQGAQGVAEAVERATLLVNLAQQQHLSVPAKTFEQLAGGREILLLCEDDCETARLVDGIAGVTQVDPSDFERLTRVLLDLYRRHVLEGLMTIPSERDVAQYSREAANERFLSIFASVAHLSAPNHAEGVARESERLGSRGNVY